MMSETAKLILVAFDALPSADQRLVVAEILRRTLDADEGDLLDDEFHHVAEALLWELDVASR